MAVQKLNVSGTKINKINKPPTLIPTLNLTNRVNKRDKNKFLEATMPFLLAYTWSLVLLWSVMTPISQDLYALQAQCCTG